MSKTSLLCHIVFATKMRERTILMDKKRELYAYINGIIQNKNCYTIRINGMDDHIHILVDMHPTVAVADLVKVIKQSSSNWLRQNWLFPMFMGWGKGYYAASIGIEGKEACRNYIMNQEEHHRNENFMQEMERAIKETQLEWYEGDWE